MTDDDVRYNQVNNIIRRSHALILNIKLLGADTTNAKDLLNTAKNALEKGDYDKAIDFAKKSMIEVMELKKKIKSGEKPPTTGKRKLAAPPAKLKEEITVEQSSDDSTAAEVKTDIGAAEAPEVDRGSIESPEYYENGFSYLIEESRADFCFLIFSKILNKNNKGLCICRINPAIIKRRYEFSEDITMLWLTDRESSKEATISPSLESMIYVAEEFIDKNEKAVILLDGIEYLISNNGFNPVLRFVRRLIDKISETSTILLIGVSSKAMNEQELKLLERELNPIIYN